MAKGHTRFGSSGRKSKHHHTRFGDGGTKKPKKGAHGSHRYDHDAGTPKGERPKRRKKSTGKRRKLRYTIRYEKPKMKKAKATPKHRPAPRAQQVPVAQTAVSMAVAPIARVPRVLVPMVAPDLVAQSPTIARALARVAAVQACPGGVCPVPTPK